MRETGVVSSICAFAIAALTTVHASTSAQARLLQILHTNDLHSHFDFAEDRSLIGLDPPHAPMGGYAQVKAKMDQLKAEAASRGIETLVLDAGDFSEGSPYFLSDQGDMSWEILNAMGYDAVALGNHDYLMGQADLDRIVGRVQPTFPVLAANFIHSRKLTNLNRHFSPYVELQRAGVKIGIMGLTTDDFVYKWRAGKNVIIPPLDALEGYIDELTQRDDYVFLLTHLGVSDDKKLIQNSSGVSLVVGGHSHTFLRQVEHQKDFDGNLVPIVQAGQHGQVVGKLIVDVEKGKPLAIQSYELVDVPQDGPKDPEVSRIFQKTKDEMNLEFGDAWLHEALGYSYAPLLLPNDGPTVWGTLVADSMKTAADADLSVDAGGQLFGDNLPAGPVTREALFRFYPRVFGFQEKEGWSVWTISVRGWVLKTIMEIAMDFGITFNVSGATYHPVKEAGLWKLHNFKIGGGSVRALHHYRVALPEGIGRAIREITPIFRLWLHRPYDTGAPIWSSIEEEFKRRGGVIQPGMAVLSAEPADTLETPDPEMARMEPQAARLRAAIHAYFGK